MKEKIFLLFFKNPVKQKNSPFNMKMKDTRKLVEDFLAVSVTNNVDFMF